MAAAVIVLVCLFGNLGAIGLVGPDEPRYVWIARDMAATHDWVTPMLYGQPWFEKPVLYYWAAAVGFLLHLPAEWAARLPSAFAALAAAVTIAWLGKRYYGTGLRFSRAVDAAVLFERRHSGSSDIFHERRGNRICAGCGAGHALLRIDRARHGRRSQRLSARGSAARMIAAWTKSAAGAASAQGDLTPLAAIRRVPRIWRSRERASRDTACRRSDRDMGGRNEAVAHRISRGASACDHRF